MKNKEEEAFLDQSLKFIKNLSHADRVEIMAPVMKVYNTRKERLSSFSLQDLDETRLNSIIESCNRIKNTLKK